MVVRARSRLPHEIGIETNFKNGPRRLIRFYSVKVARWKPLIFLAYLQRVFAARKLA